MVAVTVGFCADLLLCNRFVCSDWSCGDGLMSSLLVSRLCSVW